MLSKTGLQLVAGHRAETQFPEIPPNTLSNIQTKGSPVLMCRVRVGTPPQGRDTHEQHVDRRRKLSGDKVVQQSDAQKAQWQLDVAGGLLLGDGLLL